jgi:hypothetical protein
MKSGSPSCRWVRSLLPLLAGEESGLDDDAGDLEIEDRFLIRAHLRDCSECRARFDDLRGALAALAAAADQPLPLPRTASLWPKLEERLKHRVSAGSAFPSSAPLPGLLGRRCNAAAWLTPFDAQPASERTIQRAWRGDSLRELLDVAAAKGWLMDRLGSLPRKGPLRDGARASLVLGIALAALVVTILPILSFGQRRVENPISAKIAPLPTPRLTPPEILEQADGEPAVGTFDPAPFPALAETVAMGEGEPTREDPETHMPSHPLAQPVGGPLSTRRLDFDLERGIPMPTDFRDGNLAY